MNGVLAALRQWRPGVIYTHVIENIEFERRLLEVAPAVFFAHSYYGTCVSGSKTFKRPVARPCSRKFGWQCLVQFYPKRCGGLNPLTMFAQYRTQSARLELIKQYRNVVTHSEHMRAEFIRHGVPGERILTLPFCVRALPADAKADSPRLPYGSVQSGSAWRLAFAGRMDDSKGGLLLLHALPLLRSTLDRPVHLVFAGDGPDRELWEVEASRIQRTVHDIGIEYAGWLTDAELGALFRASDLLVVPSVSPEPFGLVGVEAAFEGLPAAAFDVGGISTWLVDGVTGHLAPADPPASAGLVNAISKCLADPSHYRDLRSGARKIAHQFTTEAHVERLIHVFEMATR
jgi:glycosyltransferase involved in cell wall biosynthesis